MGARLAGGRWNHPGEAVVYVSSTLSLAALELFVHLDARSRTALQLVAIPVKIPDGLISEPPVLPHDWRTQPPPTETKSLGSKWMNSGESCVLRVPSVLIPVEDNYVIDPTHPGFTNITIGDPEVFSFDPRMWKQS